MPELSFTNIGSSARFLRAPPGSTPRMYARSPASHFAIAASSEITAPGGMPPSYPPCRAKSAAATASADIPSYCTAKSPRRQKYTAYHVAVRRATSSWFGVTAYT